MNPSKVIRKDYRIQLMNIRSHLSVTTKGFGIRIPHFATPIVPWTLRYPS